MTTNTKSVYKRILLRLSGEVLQGSEGLGIDTSIFDCMVQKIKEPIELGIQTDVVTGDGNLFRGTGLAKVGMNHVVGDHIGMLATIVNDLVVRDVLHHVYVNAYLMSAIPLNGVCSNYSRAEVISLLRSNRVVILSADTGNPLFTTDSAACLYDIEVEADVVLKATKADGVSTADPARDPSATIYGQLTCSEVLDKGLKMMDLTAFTLARDYELSTRAFNTNKPGALHRVVMGEKGGTLTTE